MDERPSDVVVPGVSGAASGIEASAPEAAPADAGQGSDVRERGKEKVRRFGAMAREQALRRADRSKGSLASTVESFAVTLSETGQGLERRGLGSQRKAADEVAGRLRQLSRQLRENSSQDLAAQAGEQLRERPGLILAGCFALGFLGSRLLKA